MTRYLPSRNYLYLGMTALALGIGCAALVMQSTLAAIPTGLFLASAVLNFFLATRPAIVLTSNDLTIGNSTIRWFDIARIDRTGWVSPLVVWLTLHDGSRKLLVYPGALRGSRRLAADLDRRLSAAQEAAEHPAPVVEPSARVKDRLPLLTAEDEADVERLFQRLKSVGHLEQEDR